MRILFWSVWLAVLDFIGFIVLWGDNAVRGGRPYQASAFVHTLYWGFAVIGLILAVFGFVMLIRLGARHINRTVLTVLFAMVPGCAALIGILSHLGTSVLQNSVH